MKISILLISTILTLSSLANAQAKNPQQQVNFNQVLNQVQDSDWVGHFEFNALGLLKCSGPLSVKFFPMVVEDFSDGAQTMSYRHDADFSNNLNPLCNTLGKKFSVVDVGSCDKEFPKKFSVDEGQYVPFRTIIPREGGKRAFVSSPACGANGKVKRSELELMRLDLSPDQQQLEITIRLHIEQLGANVDLKYLMKRRQ